MAFRKRLPHWTNADENSLYCRLDKFRRSIESSMRYFRLADGKACVPSEWIADAVADAITSVFFKLYVLPLDEHPPDHDLRRLLFKCARNNLSNICKHHRRMLYVPDEYFEDHCRSYSNPETVTDLHLIEELLDRYFSPLDREIIILTMYGYSSEQIGDMFDMSAQTVRQHICRCRIKLRALVDEKKKVCGGGGGKIISQPLLATASPFSCSFL